MNEAVIDVGRLIYNNLDLGRDEKAEITAMVKLAVSRLGDIVKYLKVAVNKGSNIAVEFARGSTDDELSTEEMKRLETLVNLKTRNKKVVHF